MRVEGRVSEVMESMPLQLIVTSGERRIFVGLRSGTAVTRRGTLVEHGGLLPDMYLRVDGPASGREAMMADSIEILD